MDCDLSNMSTGKMAFESHHERITAARASIPAKKKKKKHPSPSSKTSGSPVNTHSYLLATVLLFLQTLP